MPSPPRGQVPVFALLLALTLLLTACSAPGRERWALGAALDADGVQRLFPTAPGTDLRLGTGDPNRTAGFIIERGTPVAAGAEGPLHYWCLPSHALTYASGGSGWTSRIHLRPGGDAVQRHTWRTQSGYLLHPDDLKNQEFTAFLRVHGVLDPDRAQVTLKIRGGAHSARAPDRASCVMLTFAPASRGSVARFGKELTHPEYDYVRLKPFFPAALEADAWVGLKLVSWNDPGDPSQVVHRLYLDTEPFVAGRPRNGWRLFSEYVDREDLSTGRYRKLVDWGGCQTTLRTDGFDRIDFALLSAREILPPR